MADLPPDWAKKRACDLVNARCAMDSYRPLEVAPHNPAIYAFAVYLAEHEQPPVDPVKAAANSDAMQEALKKAAGWFENYARQHRLKFSTEGNLKAETNEERAAYLRQVLASSPATSADLTGTYLDDENAPILDGRLAALDASLEADLNPASAEARAPVDEVDRVAGTRIAAEDFDRAAIEVGHLQHGLDITNADHIALWLETNQVQMACPAISLGWLAVQIVEAHEAATLRPASTARPDVERVRYLLDSLARAEANYRSAHDLFGDDDIRTGRSWDTMRRAGDEVRQFLLSTATEASEGEVE